MNTKGMSKLTDMFKKKPAAPKVAEDAKRKADEDVGGTRKSPRKSKG